MTRRQPIFAASALLLLTGAMAADQTANQPSNQPAIQVGEWQCGLPKNSRTGYQCGVITFRPGFGGTPQVYLSLNKLDLTGSGSVVLESVMVKVAQVSWSSFQPEVVATGWSDSTRKEHIEAHQSGNWAGTWIAVGPPARQP